MTFELPEPAHKVYETEKFHVFEGWYSIASLEHMLAAFKKQHLQTKAALEQSMKVPRCKANP